MMDNRSLLTPSNLARQYAGSFIVRDQADQPEYSLVTTEKKADGFGERELAARRDSPFDFGVLGTGTFSLVFTHDSEELGDVRPNSLLVHARRRPTAVDGAAGGCAALQTS